MEEPQVVTHPQARLLKVKGAVMMSREKKRERHMLE